MVSPTVLRLTWSSTGNPETIVIIRNRNGGEDSLWETFAGTINETEIVVESGMTYCFKLRAIKDDDTSAISGQKCVRAEPNSPPELGNIGTRSARVNQNMGIIVNAQDDEDSVRLMAKSLPDGATFTDNGNGSGIFNWTPNMNQQGTHTVTFLAIDGSQQKDSEIVPITVSIDNRPPRFTSIGSQWTIEGRELRFNITANDDNPSTLQLSATNLPSGAQFTDNNNGTGTFEWAPAEGQSGDYAILFSATDNLGEEDSEEVEIAVRADELNILVGTWQFKYINTLLQPTCARWILTRNNDNVAGKFVRGDNCSKFPDTTDLIYDGHDNGEWHRWWRVGRNLREPWQAQIINVDSLRIQYREGQIIADAHRIVSPR